MKSKWCYGVPLKNTESYGWCDSQNPLECHCTCECHKTTNIKSMISILDEIKRYLESQI